MGKPDDETDETEREGHWRNLLLALEAIASGRGGSVFLGPGEAARILEQWDATHRVNQIVDAYIHEGNSEKGGYPSAVAAIPNNGTLKLAKFTNVAEARRAILKAAGLGD